MTRFLGIDPGYDKCGWGVVDESPALIASGVIQTDKEWTYWARLDHIGLSILSIIDEFEPDVVGIEKPFSGNNVGRGVEVAGVWAVIGLAANSRHCKYMELFPTQVKAAVANGRASKDEVKRGVETILGIVLNGPDDKADGLAAAICTRDRWNLEAMAQ